MLWPLHPWLVILDMLTTYRLTRLITSDTLPPVARARDWVLDRWPGEWGAGIVCPWCVGWWVAVLVVAGHTVCAVAGVERWWVVLTLPLAVSAVVGVLAERAG